MFTIKKVLIANRGEIALRIIRACKELGLKAVAVYSEADKGALHTRIADEAYLLGPPPAAESYLRGDRIIEIAKRSGCEAIHPGYGFLAENPDFAEMVENSGLIFIGPKASSIRLMGDKITARKTAQQNNVPIIPGMERRLKDLEDAKAFASEIGYPVLIKAAAGGGGKGMRIIFNEKELRSSFARAISEVAKSFGDPSVYMEKFISPAKHIEFQILADAQGNYVYLGERECSIQRRHQKLVEESPAAKLTPKLRAEMGEAAIKIAKACDYCGAGTVEFLYDVQNDRYYFLEMNTRLQVEHPVTEMITGIDIVKEQLRVASGEPLSFTQEEIVLRGAAIECRIYAEDPEHGFQPSTGRIEELNLPTGPGVRVDCGVYRGERITPYYDPLLAKLIVWDKDRAGAIARMKRALEEFQIIGLKTTIGFHRQVMEHPDFISGEYFTDFIQRLGPETIPEDLELLAIAAVLKREQEESKVLSYSDRKEKEEDGWKSYLPWLR